MAVAKHKKWVALFLCVLLLFCLAACNKDDAESSSAVSSNSTASASADASGSDAGGDASASGASSAASAVSSSVAPPIPAGPPAVSLAAIPIGQFLHQNDEFYPVERAPYLEILPDGQGEFRVNTGAGLVTAKGTCALNGTQVIFIIEETDAEEFFWGEDLTSLRFDVLGEDELRYAGGTFGLTQRDDVLQRQGPAGAQMLEASTAPAPAPASSGAASGASRPVGSDTQTPDADSSAAGSDASDVSLSEEEFEEQEGHWDITQGKALPTKMKPGDALALHGVDVGSIRYDDSYFAAAPSEDGSAVVFTALDEGKTAIQFAFEGEESQQQDIRIAEPGVPLWLVLAAAGVAAVVASVGTVILLTTLRKRRENKEAIAAQKTEKKEQKAAKAVQAKENKATKAEESKKKKAARAEAARQKKEASAAKKAEKKAAQAAKKAEKKAGQIAKKAAKAADAAVQAEEKAAKAAERVQALGKGKGAKDDEPKEEKVGKKEEKPAASGGGDQSAEDGQSEDKKSAKEEAPKSMWT